MFEPLAYKKKGRQVSLTSNRLRGPVPQLLGGPARCILIRCLVLSQDQNHCELSRI